jgi:hypothetical protein
MLGINETPINASPTTAQDPVPYLKAKGVKSLWHITDRRNLDSIFKLGILSPRLLAQNRLKVAAYISLPSSRQAEKAMNHDKYLHLGFHDQYPMVYSAKNAHPELDLWKIEIHPAVLNLQKEFLVSTHNSLDRHTRFFKGALGLQEIRYDLFQDLKKGPRQDFKRFQAEILVLRRVPPEFLIHCQKWQA